jgi:biotin carboxyl carrier protein
MNDARTVDQRAVRVSVADSLGRDRVEPIVIEPPAAGGQHALVLVDSLPTPVRLERFDAIHRALIEGPGDGVRRTAVSLLAPQRSPGPFLGSVGREVLVDGWLVIVEIESERRASLRARARRGPEDTVHGGPTQVRAIIPGRIISVAVLPGDPVEAGQELLVVEAMKMQNELRAPRDGVVSRVGVGVGETVEVGDLLVVLE